MAYLGEVSLDPVSVRLLLGQSGPVLGLGVLLSENENDRSGSVQLLGLLEDVSSSSLVGSQLVGRGRKRDKECYC